MKTLEYIYVVHTMGEGGCGGNIPNYASQPALHGELHVTTSIISQTPPVQYITKAQLLLRRRTRSLSTWATTAPNAKELLDPRDN